MVAVGARPRVLVVDDDRDFADSMADVLGLRGYDVDLAYSGEAAVRRCQAADYDVALIDIRMPGVSGVESLVEIRHAKPGTRVVLMTGYSVPELIREAVDRGAFGVVKKPLDLEALISLIEQPRDSGTIPDAPQVGPAAPADCTARGQDSGVETLPATGPRNAPLDDHDNALMVWALHKTQARLLDIAHCAADWFWELDEELRFVFASESYQELTGLDPEQHVLGKTMSQLAAAPGRMIECATGYDLHHRVAEVLARREPFRDALVTIMPDSGAVRYWCLSGKPVFGPEGEFRGFRGTTRDVTEQRRAEDARRQSEDNYRALVEDSEQGVLVHRNLVPLFANQACAEILGYDSVDQVVALPSLAPHVPEHERERLQGYMRARMRGESAPTLYETDAVRRDGQTITLQTIARVITWDGEPALQTVYLDVTERRIADQALRESEQRFRAIAEVTPYALLIARKRDGQILYANEVLRQTVGFRDDPLNHKSVELYWDPTERRELLDSLDAHGRRLGHELRHRRANGEMFWAVTSSVEMDFEGQPAMLTAFIDITDRKRAEEALHESEQRFREHLEDLVRSRTEALESTQRELLRAERLAAIGQLTSTVGHELRNPLGTIRTSLFALRDRIDTSEQRTADTLGRIERSIERCDNIIQELLDYTRAPKLQRQEIELDAWLRSLIGDLHLPDDVEVESDLNCEGRVGADVQRLGQAIVNLVNNACQAMVERKADGGCSVVRIGSRAASNRVEVSVSDAGPGISPDTLEHIFEPLFSTRAFGVGLGLPLVKQVMEQHGGGVAVNSVVGKGTTMTLWIPRPGSN